MKILCFFTEKLEIISCAIGFIYTFMWKKKRAMSMLSHTEATGWRRSDHLDWWSFWWICSIDSSLDSPETSIVLLKLTAHRNTIKSVVFNTEPSDYNKATCFSLKIHVCTDLYSICVLLCLWTIILMSHMQSSSKSQLCKEKCHTEKVLVQYCFIVLWTNLPQFHSIHFLLPTV